MDPKVAKSHTREPSYFSYTPKDAILYSLGIGARVERDLHFLYENNADFEVFPTFVVAPGFAASSLSDWPGISFDLAKILHGEHYIELFDQLPPNGGELRSETRVADIADKGIAALILADVTTFDSLTNRKIAYQQFGVLQMGGGNFGGQRTVASEKSAIPVPKRDPDFVEEKKISSNQAALYRLGSGDYNPLHIDSEFAQMSGFKKPILHGLCTLGFATRTILRQYGGNRASNFIRLKVRFSSPVIPGQTLQTQMWREGTRIHFQAKIKETGKLVLSSGYVDLKLVDQSATSASNAKDGIGTLKSQFIIDAIGDGLETTATSEMANLLVLYDITRNGEHAAHLTLDLRKKSGDVKGVVYCGRPRDEAVPSVIVTLDDAEFASLVVGKIDQIEALLSARLKIDSVAAGERKLSPRLLTELITSMVKKLITLGSSDVAKSKL